VCAEGHAEPTYRWRVKGDRVNPDSLRAICDSLNDERGTGGQSKLTRLLGWHHSTVWRKLNVKSPITLADELAIRQVSLRTKPPCNCPSGGKMAEKLMHTRFLNRLN
jgi:hypothetical protein